MANLLLAAGLVAAVPLLTLLLATRLLDRFRFWPTPGTGSWQSVLFWPLFRILNLATVGVAILDRTPALGLPVFVRAAGLLVLAVSGSLYLFALLTLGRGNTYCGREGLVTAGLYRWTRNPQYASVIPAYAGLAVAADSYGVYLLTTMLVAVYVLMALVEEPWLRQHYGEAYDRYTRTVPRFFNVRRAVALLRFVSFRLYGHRQAGLYHGPARARRYPAAGGARGKPGSLSHS
jgi:protein-S-isoprenylcysteine O-methyltransferase Ste14